MADLNDVVKGALDAATAEPADAGGGDDGADATSEVETGAGAAAEDGDGEAAASAAGESATPAAEATTETTAPVSPPEPVDSDLAREMEALGLKHVAGKDNRIPYSRVMKIVENARKRAADEHAKVQEQAKKDYETAQAELANFRAVDQLIQSDPERYLTLLSSYVPAYQKFLQQQQAAQATPAPAQGDAMPQPDTKFADGSPGYSPDQHAKLLDWIGRQAEERALKRVDQQYQQRFAPIEQRFKQEQMQAQMRQQAQAQIADLHEAWGKELVDKHEQEIVKFMQANPRVSFQAAAAKVLLPKLQADRTRQREELLKELEQRPRAAAPSPSSPAKTPASTGPRSTEDIIKEAIAAIR